MLYRGIKNGMFIKLRFSLCVFLALMISISVYGQSNVGLHSRMVNSFDGLSSDHINQAIEDKEGMIWLATAKGLNRYDGKNVVRYIASKDDINGLPHNDVRTLLVTQMGELWIGTQNGLVKKTRNDKFVEINNESLGEDVFLSDQIIKLVQASNGNIWIAMQKGLVVISPDLKDFHSYSNTLNNQNGDDESQLPGSDISDIFEDKFGNIWLTTWAGGLTLALSDSPSDLHSFSFSSMDSEDLNLPKNITFQNILQDENNNIWLQEAFGAFYRLDIKSGSLTEGLNIEDIELKKFDFGVLDDIDNYVTTSEYIEGKGMFVSTLNESYLIPLETLEGDSNSYSSDIVEVQGLALGQDIKNDIFIDSRNIAWVSSNKGVFMYFGFVNLLFDKYPNYHSTIERTKVSGIYYDYSGTWLGTNDALYIDNRKELIEVKYNGKSIRAVTSFAKTSNGNLWLGTIEGKLYELEKLAGSYKVTERKVSGIEAYIGNNHIWNIVDMRDGTLWLATHVGIYIYDISHHLSHKLSIQFDEFELYDFNCFDIVNDSNGNIYISATGIGLIIGIPDSTKVGGYSYELKKQGGSKSEISSNVIFDLDVSGDELWIAQNTGLEVYNILTDSFLRIPQLDESVNTQVFSVVATEEKVWATTTTGITNFSIKDNTVRNFNVLDGVIENHTMLGHYKNSDGDIFFAGSGGYHVLDKDKNFEKLLTNEIVISNLSINNEPIKVGENDPIFDRPILTDDLNEIEKITLSHSHKNVVISFSVHDFISPHQYEYSYILKGISDEWIAIGQEQKIPFSQLPNKSFEIGFRAKDQFGQLTKEKFLAVEVVTPFWKRSTSIIWIGLLSFLVVYSIMKFKERKVKEQNLRLERAVGQRTIKLKDQNQKLEKYIESNMKLENFAHAASHDLKAPLRNISAFAGLLKLRMMDKMDDKEISYFSEIETGTKRLNSLVEDILSYSKLNSDELKIENYSIAEAINEVIDSLQKTIQDKNAKVNFEMSNEFDIIPMDKIKIMRVIQNLLTNAIKFMPEDRNPEIEIVLKQDDQFNYIKIKDNGIGISQENQKEIFTLFKRVAHTSAFDGTGFGLTIAKKIMNLHKGDLIVNSVLEKGSVFTMQFPRESSDVLSNKMKANLESVEYI